LLTSPALRAGLCVLAGYAVLTSAESDDQVDVTLIHFSDTHARWESTQYEDRWLCSQWEEDNGVAMAFTTGWYQLLA
jgi:2',3'-cyclic-nucleotide 2'-phosphodiesterase (5'-nucleotidase family)